MAITHGLNSRLIRPRSSVAEQQHSRRGEGIMNIRTFLIAFILVLAFASVAKAGKPTVSIADMVPRASHIVVSKVVAETLVSPARKTASGEWSPEKRRVTVQTEHVLKTSSDTPIPKIFEFEVEALLFEKSTSYVLFLTAPAATSVPKDDKTQAPTARFEHLGSPARRVEATEAAIREVQKEIEATRQAK